MSLSPGNKALFLDRDGVINKEINYLHKIEDFEFLPGIFEVCQFVQQHGYQIFVVTNQAGIARGFYSEPDFQSLTDWMLDQFKAKEVNISKVYYCPYHATAGVGRYKKDSFDRKPNPGMLLKARDEFGIDLGGSLLIGDKETDIEAGINAGVGTNILLTAEKAPLTQASFTVTDIRGLPDILKL